MTPHIADEIGQKMTAEGVSVYALSQQSGIPRATLQRRLARPESFTVAELDSIAVVLNCGSALDLLANAARNQDSRPNATDAA